jgi:NAD(P)H dehydrogenase (quinone)
MNERPVRIAVIFHSESGTVRHLADGIAAGARAAGADVRLRRIPDAGEATSSSLPAPTLADLEWADGVALGTPTRFGNVTAELKRFIDSTFPLWERGGLVDLAVTGFTAAASAHGGQEVTLLALYQSVYHWGGVIVPAGYVDPVQREAGGNPYGLSARASRSGRIDGAAEGAARVLGARLASVADRLRTRNSGDPVRPGYLFAALPDADAHRTRHRPGSASGGPAHLSTNRGVSMTRIAHVSCLRGSDLPEPALPDIGDPGAGVHGGHGVYRYAGLVLDLVDLRRDPDATNTPDPSADPVARLRAARSASTLPYTADGDEAGGSVAHEFYRYDAEAGQPGGYRSLIVARIAVDAEKRVADIFAESDAGVLPGIVGVTSRSLLRLGSLYLHYIEADRPIGPAVARHRTHPAFVDINERLDAYITPYDPATWRSPADAMATEIRYRPVSAEAGDDRGH